MWLKKKIKIKFNRAPQGIALCFRVLVLSLERTLYPKQEKYVVPQPKHSPTSDMIYEIL